MTKRQADGVIPHRIFGDGVNTILFVHGFLDAGAIWKKVIAGLTGPKGFRTVTLDLPGMGSLTETVEGISLERYASDVGDVLKTLNGPVLLVGQSMGAQVVELVALANPSLVAGLVLITPVPLKGARVPPETVQSFKKLGGASALQRLTREQLSDAISDSDLDELGRFGEAVSATVVARLVDVWNNGHPQGEQPSRFTGPTLLIRGASDPFITETVTRDIAQRFTNVREATIEHAGHWAHFEQAGAVVHLLKAFASEIEWDLSGVKGAAEDWKGAFAERTATAFGEAFSEDVVLEATTLYSPITGFESVKRVMEAASNIYESLIFTDQATDGPRQYIEWKAEAFGGVQLGGVTVITRNELGQIARVAIHHRPLHGVLQFSQTIGERLRGVIDPSHFLVESALLSDIRNR